MSKINAVNFKGQNNKLVVFLDPTASFEDICAAFSAKLKEHGKFFAAFGSVLEFSGKELAEDEFARLFKIIDEESNMTIGFVIDATGQSRPSVKLKEEPKKPEVKEPEVKTVMAATDTYFHIGTLRSGQSIEHSGSVVVMGDVNGGAEVLSACNIIVLGVVRGLVAAGVGGNENAFIGALSLQPEQFISIAGVRINYTKEMLKEIKTKIEPVYAHLKDGNIYIDYLSGMLFDTKDR